MTGRDWAALVLATFAGLAMLTVALGAIRLIGEVITPSEGELLAAVLGAAIGAVATYLGGRGQPPVT